jgi:antibiotic biosynthesis monooxygenase (ABM) superfamily enzyme
MNSRKKFLAALKVWVVIYPSITLFLFLFGDQLSYFPLVLRTLFLTAVLVPWMVFVGLPFLEYMSEVFVGTIKRKK